MWNEDHCCRLGWHIGIYCETTAWVSVAPALRRLACKIAVKQHISPLPPHASPWLASSALPLPPEECWYVCYTFLPHFDLILNSQSGFLDTRLIWLVVYSTFIISIYFLYPIRVNEILMFQCHSTLEPTSIFNPWFDYHIDLHSPLIKQVSPTIWARAKTSVSNCLLLHQRSLVTPQCARNRCAQSEYSSYCTNKVREKKGRVCRDRKGGRNYFSCHHTDCLHLLKATIQKTCQIATHTEKGNEWCFVIVAVNSNLSV